MKHHRTGRRRPGRGGFSLMEVLLALMFFTLMTLMFGAVVPIAVYSSHAGSHHTQAVLLAQHKIDQLRSAGFGSLDRTSLVNRGIIDSTNPVPPATGPFVYTFTRVDNLTDSADGPGVFPAGTTGTITLTPVTSAPRDPAAAVNPSFDPGSSVVTATVTINWRGGGRRGGSYSACALIIQMAHQ